MGTLLHSNFVPVCPFVHTPHRSDGNWEEVTTRKTLTGCSHSTQVRWELIKANVGFKVLTVFTLHTGQMGTCRTTHKDVGGCAFTLHTGQMGTYQMNIEN